MEKWKNGGTKMSTEISIMIGKVLLGLIMVFVGVVNFFIPFNSKEIILILLILGGMGTIMWGYNNERRI